MKLKDRIKTIQMIFLVMTIAFSSFFISACEKTSAIDLTLDNYTQYLEVRCGTTGGRGAWNFWMSNGYVRIKKVSNSSSFQNVAITYKFKIYDAGHTINAEQEFTATLGNLNSDYSKSFELRFGHTNGNFPPELFTTVEVLEISGTGTLISGENLSMYIGIGFLFVLVFGLLLFFPIRAGIFSSKFNKITNGMKYQEVIYALGEPNESNSAKGITTCIWKRAILHGWTKTYVLTFKDNEVILDIAHSNWS